MEVKAYYTNFTFEEELNVSQVIQYRKINNLFEFLFLWIEDSSKFLWSRHPYPREYLDKIKYFTDSTPGLVQNTNCPVLWWGNSRDPREKVINEKKTSFLVRNEMGLQLDNSFIAEDLESLDMLHSSKEYIFKGLLGFSGRDQVRDIKRIGELTFPIIVEPLLKRKQDIGITFLSSEKYFAIENFNNNKGQFKGGILLDEIPTHIILAGRKIFKWYRDAFGIDSLQIDMFSYLEEETEILKWNYLCEVNHRKTMGWILWKLQKIFKTRFAAFKILQKNTGIWESSLDLTIVELSPPEHMVKVLYIGGESEDILNSYLQNLV